MSKNELNNNVIINTHNNAVKTIDKCPYCTGNLRRSNDRTSYLCEYCGRTFYINVDERSSIQKINNAETHYHNFHDIPKAIECYLEASELNPGDYRCWFGLAKASTDNFTDLSLSTSEINKIETEYIFRALRTSDSEIENSIQTTFNEYKKKVSARIEHDRSELNNRITSYNNNRTGLENRIKNVKNSLENHRTKSRELENANTSLNKKIKDPDNYDGGMVLGFIGSIIATLILGKLLFFTTDKSWDFSTLFVGIPFIVAAFGLICTSLYMLIMTIGNAATKGSNSNLRTKITNNNQDLSVLASTIKTEETLLSDLMSELSSINQDITSSKNKCDTL